MRPRDKLPAHLARYRDIVFGLSLLLRGFVERAHFDGQNWGLVDAGRTQYKCWVSLSNLWELKRARINYIDANTNIIYIFIKGIYESI